MGCTNSASLPNDQRNGDIGLTSRTVEKYIEKEQIIAQLELQIELEGIQEKESALESIDEAVKKSKLTLLQLSRQQTGGGDLRTYLTSGQPSKQQEEAIEMLNQRQIIECELASLSAQHDQLSQNVRLAKKKSNALTELYEQQDSLLDQIFGGKYGSEAENRLEAELDSLLAERKLVASSKFRWTNAGHLAERAANQFAIALARWSQQVATDKTLQKECYDLRTRTRDNLLAASTNVRAIYKYLQLDEMAYCGVEEMNLINKAIANIYHDARQPQSEQSSLQLFQRMHRSASALRQWIQLVLKETIEQEAENVCRRVARKNDELKAERLRLIRAMMPDSDTQTRFTNLQITRSGKMDAIEVNVAELQVAVESAESKVETTEALPDLKRSELAPLPSRPAVLGDRTHLERPRAGGLGGEKKDLLTNRKHEGSKAGNNSNDTRQQGQQKRRKHMTKKDKHRAKIIFGK